MPKQKGKRRRDFDLRRIENRRRTGILRKLEETKKGRIERQETRRKGTESK